MGPHEVRDGVYIGNQGDAERKGDKFEHVITLSLNPDMKNNLDDDGGEHEHTTQFHPLIDGRNDQKDFETAVGATVKAIEEHDGDVLVHCYSGISRSSAVLITALAYIDDSTFEEVYDEVWEAKPSIAPHPELRKLGLGVLGEDGSVYKNPF